MNWLERMDPRHSWLSFLWAAGLGFTILFVMLDPRPSRGLDFDARLAFWALHILIPLALAQASQLAFTAISLGFANIWASLAMAGIAASAIFAPVALALDIAFSAAGGFLRLAIDGKAMLVRNFRHSRIVLRRNQITQG